MSPHPAYYGDGYHRSSLNAYRASPALHRDGSGGRGSGGSGSGSGPTRSYGFGPVRGMAGPDLYGFEYAEGLPGFEGTVADVKVAAGSPRAADFGPAAPQAQFLAQLCHVAMADFRQQHAWDARVAAAVETALRTMAAQATPSHRDQQVRLQTMDCLKELAESGIRFCQGLDLEPYGSFVSGLYTPQGDLDLSIEGQAIWREIDGQVQHVTVDGMEREMKVKILRALSNRIQAKPWCVGRVDRILHARVPILKFRDFTGLDVDVGIGGSHALFKSTILGLLAQFDWRFGALVRLIKLWARHHGINDSANGTLNSFALTLLVVFHLQTRSPAVLPPLCELFELGPGDERPMQGQRFPDWHLLRLACERLSQMSRLGGPGGAPGGARGNSETLLELLASFFALYEGVLLTGWTVSKGADALALCSVLRRVRVNTWAGRLYYERWDRDDYCMSIEDPFDSTDNCARTVRAEDKVERIRTAVVRGRYLLMDLQTPKEAESALDRLFGPGALRPHQLADLLRVQYMPAALQWVRPTDLIIPPRVQTYTAGRIPRTVHVNHKQPRGGGGTAALQHQVEGVTQQLQQIELHGSEQVPTHQQHAAPPPPPGIGLPPGAPIPALRPAAAVQAQQVQQAPLASLHELRALIEGSVSEEAARLAEINRAEAEAAEAQQAARQERRAAKKAAQKAQQAAKRAERQRLRAERGRSRSRSRTHRRSGSRRSSRSRSTSLAAAQVAASVAVGNLSSSSSLATPVTENAVASSSTAVGPAVAGNSAAAAAVVSELHAGVVADMAGAVAGPSISAVEATGAPGPLAAVLAEDAAAASDHSGNLSSGSGGKKEKRFGKNMKAAAVERKQRRASSAAAGEAASAAAAGAEPAATQTVQRAKLKGQHPASPQEGKQQRQRNHARGRGQGGGRGGDGPEGEAAAPAARVLVVPRPSPAPAVQA